MIRAVTLLFVLAEMIAFLSVMAVDAKGDDSYRPQQSQADHWFEDFNAEFVEPKVVKPPSLLASADEFDDFMKQELGEFKKYQDERDKAFSDLLNKDWREFQMNFGIIRDAKPKPVVFPVAPLSTTPAVPEEKPEEVVKVEKVKPSPAPRTPRPKKVPSSQFKGKSLKIEFFGMTVVLKIDPKFATALGQPINKTAISDFWKVLSTSDYKPLMKQLQNYRQSMTLNDWGYAQLVNKVAQTIYRNRPNEVKMFDWFVLTKAGYSARIGYNDSTIYLMLPAKTQFYEVPYFTYDGRQYYVVSFSGRADKVSKLYSYEGNYARANNPIDLALNQLPQFEAAAQQRALQFKFEEKQYDLSVQYDRNLVDYLKVYPVTELDVYFRSTLSEQLQFTLLNALKPMVEGRSEETAVNLLLRFVQTAFEYKTDGDQFGREKYFFPEELFLYPYSDCEDRSVLFAYLVKNLLGLDVVALDFPGHVATAVKFKGKVKGSAITYQNQRYVISDPTYINARAGMVMPRYKSTKPKVVPIATH